MRHRGLLLLALLAGCTEEATDEPEAEDAAASDADVDGARAGAACTVDQDCAGACLRDVLDPAMGRRCFPPCDESGACPAGEACVAGEQGGRGCVRVDAGRPAGAGEACDDGRPCVEGLACSADHPAGVVCAPACVLDADCPEGTRCAPESIVPRVCLPPEAAAFGCPHVPCARPDLLCVDEGDGPARCLAPCATEGDTCPEGGECTRRMGDGALFCRPAGDQPLGGPCLSGGDAACAEGLSCLARGPGDPEAVCSRPCQAGVECCPDCATPVVCRRPAGLAARWCVPAPFGAGAEDGAAGADCAAHGATDCLPALDCVPAPGGGRVCAAPCAAGSCEADSCEGDGVCAPRSGLGDYCLAGPAGASGAPCRDGTGCEGVCVEDLPPDERYCTVACPATACPAHMHCDGAFCRPGAAAERPLGAPCDDGVASCASRVCATHPETGAAVCSARCGEGLACPAGFDCLTLKSGELCFAPAD